MKSLRTSDELHDSLCAPLSKCTGRIARNQITCFIQLSCQQPGRKIEILIRPGGLQNEGGRSFADAIICGLQLVPGF
jgi:hypothetical protein